ncbi:hypothetical protein [Pseudomonas sp. 2995-1]|uniref:hypothetical protein n=1 Tax=Pseudomonas sp. 2995-1 TaxID=1712679 RepID=UPI00117A8C21|nr:hypothetical protein [Pseudomonas sp. 2995-1]
MNAEEYLRSKGIGQNSYQKASWYLKLSSMAVVIVVGVVTSFASFQGFLEIREKAATFARVSMESVVEPAVPSQKIMDLQKEILALKALMSSLGTPVVSDQQGALIKALESKVTAIDTRLILLESSISTTPERALSVPMLRKDYDALAKLVSDNSVAVKLEYERLWSVFFLILSAVATVVVVGGGWLFKVVLRQPSTTVQE